MGERGQVESISFLLHGEEENESIPMPRESPFVARAIGNSKRRRKRLESLFFKIQPSKRPSNPIKTH